MQHKRNKQSRKEFVKEKLREFFKTAQNEKVLKSALGEFGFELYQRGKNTGIKYKNQSFRLSTLGFDKAYAKFTKEKSAQNKEQSKNKEQEHTSKREASSNTKEQTAEGTTFKEEPIYDNTHSK